MLALSQAIGVLGRVAPAQRATLLLASSYSGLQTCAYSGLPASNQRAHHRKAILWLMILVAHPFMFIARLSIRDNRVACTDRCVASVHLCKGPVIFLDWRSCPCLWRAVSDAIRHG